MQRFRLSAFADEAGQDLTEQIRALKDNGISLVELRNVNGKSCADLTDAEVKEMRAALDGEGIRLSALGSPYGKYPIEAPFAPHLDAFKRGLEIAAGLGADRIRMFSFHMPKSGQTEPAHWRGEVIDRLGIMLDLAEEAGILLCHENEKGIYGDTDFRCADLLQVCGGRMGFVFDPANFIQCGVETVPAFRRLKNHITYMHVKDALYGSGSVVPAGKGEGAVESILGWLDGEETVLTLEPHLTVFSGLEKLQAEALTHAYTYPDGRTAFCAAVAALKDILQHIGYAEGENGIWKR